MENAPNGFARACGFRNDGSGAVLTDYGRQPVRA